MKVQEGFHRFMVKMYNYDGSLDSRCVTRWVGASMKSWEARLLILAEFEDIYGQGKVNVEYSGPVVYEYKYDDWEIGI
jgi:hypothetical protein